MRTREEQARALSSDFFDDGSSEDDARKMAMEHILEAELRAEQRVRAEIARDSERLDWLEKTSVNAEDLNIHCLMNTDGRTSFGVCGTGNYEETLRQAIDAARENAND